MACFGADDFKHQDLFFTVLLKPLDAFSVILGDLFAIVMELSARS